MLFVSGVQVLFISLELVGFNSGQACMSYGVDQSRP